MGLARWRARHDAHADPRAGLRHRRPGRCCRADPGTFCANHAPERAGSPHAGNVRAGPVRGARARHHPGRGDAAVDPEFGDPRDAAGLRVPPRTPAAAHAGAGAQRHAGGHRHGGAGARHRVRHHRGFRRGAHWRSGRLRHLLLRAVRPHGRGLLARTVLAHHSAGRAHLAAGFWRAAVLGLPGAGTAGPVRHHRGAHGRARHALPVAPPRGPRRAPARRRAPRPRVAPAGGARRRASLAIACGGAGGGRLPGAEPQRTLVPQPLGAFDGDRGRRRA